MTTSLCTCKKVRKQIDVRLIVFPVCLYGLFCIVANIFYPGLWAILTGVAFAVYLILIIKNLKDKHKPWCSLRKSFIDLAIILPTMITNI